MKRWPRIIGSLIGASALAAGLGAAPPGFRFEAAGHLATGSGTGVTDSTVYVPNMRFPLEAAPAFANSQVWGRGGLHGGGGGQCERVNYSYPWRDNFCETRSWTMPLCPSSSGHQGQDIRPATCRKDVHWAVAAVDGTITKVGSYSVYLMDNANTRLDYLHMGSVQVSVGQRVTRGTRLGRVSNVFNGTPTTIHLHFSVLQNTEHGWLYVPPFTSLVKAYEAMQP